MLDFTKTLQPDQPLIHPTCILTPPTAKAGRSVKGNDVWIGHNAVIMGGVALEDGAVIGAGAVVTHNVAPYEIVGGVPAQHIGWRYDSDMIAALLRIRWWDWTREQLQKRILDLNDVSTLIRKYDS